MTADNRRSVEAVLWMARTGSPWRDLPEGFGHWNSVFKRFRRWVNKGVFERLFEVLSGQADFEYCLDRRHDHARTSARHRGKRGTETQAIGRSRGGLTTKVLALVDALGNLARFILLPGQRHDSVGVDPLLDGVAIEALIADKAFDNNTIRRTLDDRGALAVIPSKADRKVRIPYDVDMYRWRHLVENYFAKIKEFRRIATRYDKTDTSFEAMIQIAATAIALR